MTTSGLYQTLIVHGVRYRCLCARRVSWSSPGKVRLCLAGINICDSVTFHWKYLCLKERKKFISLHAYLANVT